MKASNALWKETLAGRLAADLAQEIDAFELELELKRQGKLEDRILAETRLRRGVYGQRYDNGQRHDGEKVRRLEYPSGALTKGPNTLWDAPGMQRIKVPFGGLNPEQLETLAALAEEYADGVLHVTTRQDFQLHFVHLDDTPTLMRRLAAVGITTREACGNVVRNVTACPYAGVCAGEAFDVTPYARALSRFLLGHPDCQDFGRKFKPAFSGCRDEACGLTSMHDLGLIAVTRGGNGALQRGFEMYVGGGLGAVPHKAKLLEEFVAPEELLPTAQAIARVFARLGEKKNRNRARIKFLIKDLGIEKFRDLVREERATLAFDPRWHGYIAEALAGEEGPLNPPGPLRVPAGAVPYQRWAAANVRLQRQQGYAVATVALPLGDLTPRQARTLADLARRYTRGTVRTTVEQNIILRWVSTRDLPALYADLAALGLGEASAGTILDIVACPGTDTCKLGISSSRGLAGELRRRLAETALEMDEAVRSLHIKISGCFNSCGQHHIADLGFYGVSRKLAGYRVPHFQVVLGGEWSRNAAEFGLPIVAIPSKRVPDAVSRITRCFVAERRQGETFQAFVQRVGKARIKALLDDLTAAPADASERSFFRDWGDAREYSIEDIGVGECAGEVVTLVEFGLSAAEREVFEAQLALEQGRTPEAGQKAYGAMMTAAASVLRTELDPPPAEGDRIVTEFRERLFATEKFHDPFAGGKFAHYLFAAHAHAGEPRSAEAAHHLIEEAQLFVEAAHSYYNRLVVR
ncbi:MAG: nitrite/sulfite reductase [Candidatus Lambdaproteobacteria bacterium]|nr:nitrite/sulfite reductase [Candidatus Lambdaproteobacteria bacterium]